MTEQEVERLTQRMADGYPCSQQGCRDTGEQFAALVAEVRRLRALVREALIEGVLWPLDELHAQDCWERSNARKALEGA